MLQHLPAGLGRMLRNMRPGLDELVFHDPRAAAPDSLTVMSDALEDGISLPARFTEDGEKLSPPLIWTGVPAETAAVLVLVEDPDSPTPKPLVHAVVLDRSGGDGELLPGQLSGHTPQPDHLEIGKNSFLSRSYLPPDPPPGHGLHRYVFQVFALAEAPDFYSIDGRGAALQAMEPGVLAKGLLVGTYERG